MKSKRLFIKFSCFAFLACVLIASLSSFIIRPEDRRYADYFLRMHAAELFRTQSFILNKSWSYVSTRRLEKIEMRFSCYKVLSLNQARKLIISIATELIDKINADSVMKEKHLITEPFTFDRLKLEIRTDNILSENADVASVRVILLDGGELTYETYPLSTLYSGGPTKTYKETYEYALMLLDDPALLEMSDVKIYSQLTAPTWKGTIYSPETPAFQKGPSEVQQAPLFK